jgi:hypothetical protein
MAIVWTKVMRNFRQPKLKLENTKGQPEKDNPEKLAT